MDYLEAYIDPIILPPLPVAGARCKAVIKAGWSLIVSFLKKKVGLAVSFHAVQVKGVQNGIQVLQISQLLRIKT